jgi:hypothetical protein
MPRWALCCGWGRMSRTDWMIAVAIAIPHAMFLLLLLAVAVLG